MTLNLIIKTKSATAANLLSKSVNEGKPLGIACPKTTPCIIDKNNPWWTKKNHHDARKHLTKLYKKEQKQPNDSNITEYKKAKTEYAKLCRNSQDKGWNKFKSKTEIIKK